MDLVTILPTQFIPYERLHQVSSEIVQGNSKSLQWQTRTVQSCSSDRLVRLKSVHCMQMGQKWQSKTRAVYSKTRAVHTGAEECSDRLIQLETDTYAHIYLIVIFLYQRCALRNGSTVIRANIYSFHFVFCHDVMLSSCYVMSCCDAFLSTCCFYTMTSCWHLVLTWTFLRLL